MASARLEEFIRKIPKAELHLHLEGSIGPARFLQLSRSQGTEWSGWDAASISGKLFRYADFHAFLGVFKTVCQHLLGAEEYRQLLVDLEDYFDSQNIRYAEIIYTPSIPWKFGRDGAAILDQLLETSRKIEARGRVQIRWILDCVRQFGPETAQRTAELAASRQADGVLAIGLGGDENSLPAADYSKVFAWARANSLHAHVHAGETGGPHQVWEALKILGANRIGHGIQAARDPRLMEYLREHAIGLDVCLSSNAQTGAWGPTVNNPFGLLHKRGVPVTLNTDDPGLFKTDLCQEYMDAARFFDLDEHALSHIALQGVRCSFLPHAEKMRLMQDFQDQIHQLLNPAAAPLPS